MNLAETLARADALRAEADRADREIRDYVSAELDALPVAWDGPLYSFCNAMERGGALTSNPDVAIGVNICGDGSWYFWSSAAGASGSSAREAFDRLLASLA